MGEALSYFLQVVLDTLHYFLQVVLDTLHYFLQVVLDTLHYFLQVVLDTLHYFLQVVLDTLHYFLQVVLDTLHYFLQVVLDALHYFLQVVLDTLHYLFKIKGTYNFCKVPNLVPYICNILIYRCYCRPTGIRTPTNRTKIWCATVTPWVFRFKWCKYTDFIINHKNIFHFFSKIITKH